MKFWFVDSVLLLDCCKQFIFGNSCGLQGFIGHGFQVSGLAWHKIRIQVQKPVQTELSQVQKFVQAWGNLLNQIAMQKQDF